MNLNEFISKSLLEIISGLKDVQREVPGLVNTGFGNSNAEFVKMGVTQFQVIEFEVLIRAEEKSGKEAKLNVVAAMVGGSIKGESAMPESHSATLRFNVPINLEAIRRG